MKQVLEAQLQKDEDVCSILQEIIEYLGIALANVVNLINPGFVVVDGYIMKNDVKVLYKVTIKYKGIDKIPTGILIEAQSLDDDFSVCEFCYNVQKNAKFNYKDGSIIEYRKFTVIEKVKRVIENSKKSNTSKNRKNQINNYVINRKTNEFHLKDSNCANLKNVDSKYINETTATREELIKANLKQCPKCN